MDFIAATDILFDKTLPADLASYMQIKESAIKQARITKEDTKNRRAPPPDWEIGVAAVARQRIMFLKQLIKALEPYSPIAAGLQKERPDLPRETVDRVADAVRGALT